MYALCVEILSLPSSHSGIQQHPHLVSATISTTSRSCTASLVDCDMAYVMANFICDQEGAKRGVGWNLNLVHVRYIVGFIIGIYFDPTRIRSAETLTHCSYHNSPSSPKPPG